MGKRCPDARLSGTAVLDNFRFRINSRGVATVVATDGGEVHGVLWELNRSDERSLDEYEGVVSGLYRKETVSVLSKSGSVRALIYLAADEGVGEARPGYMGLILAAARENRFPREYIEELAQWS